MPVCRLAINVHPGARVDGVRLVDGVVRVRVSAPPQDGKANAAVEALMAEALGVAKSEVRLVVGARSRRKVVEVPLSEDELLTRLGAAP